MKNRRQKREVAIQKSKRKKAAIITVGIMIAIAFAGMIVFAVAQGRGSRVFVNGNERVTLQDNGNFRAALSHGVMIYGTYSENQNAEVISITFSSDRGEQVGTIEGGVLTIPAAWGDACGHGLDFKRR
jgi:hypothetical protein